MNTAAQSLTGDCRVSSPFLLLSPPYHGEFSSHGKTDSLLSAFPFQLMDTTTLEPSAVSGKTADVTCFDDVMQIMREVVARQQSCSHGERDSIAGVPFCSSCFLTLAAEEA